MRYSKPPAICPMCGTRRNTAKHQDCSRILQQTMAKKPRHTANKYTDKRIAEFKTMFLTSAD